MKYKIIDFDKKGNVVRFFLGKLNLDSYYGDDWDDRPYEHNAGQVYDKYVSDYIDVVFPYDYSVLEPQDDWRYDGNSPFCKDDFVDRKAPCIIAIKETTEYTQYDDCYSELLGSNAGKKFYYGDIIEKDKDTHLTIFEEDNVVDKVQEFVTIRREK